MTVDALLDRLTLEEKAALTSGSVPATCFPPAATVASSWDPALVYEVGQAIAQEARAINLSVVLGPGVNIKRSPSLTTFVGMSPDHNTVEKMAATRAARHGATQ